MRYPVLALIVIALLSSALFRFEPPRTAGASTSPLVVTVDDIGPAAPLPPLPPMPPQEPAYVPIDYRLELLEKKDASHDRAFQQIANIIQGLANTVDRLSKSHAREPVTKAEEPRPAAAAPVALLQRSILMETAPERIGCLPCKAWVRVEKPVCEADGPGKWQVDVQESSDGPWPRFTVKIGDLQVRENGYLTQKRLKDIERAILDELARRK